MKKIVVTTVTFQRDGLTLVVPMQWTPEVGRRIRPPGEPDLWLVTKIEFPLAGAA